MKRLFSFSPQKPALASLLALPACRVTRKTASRGMVTCVQCKCLHDDNCAVRVPTWLFGAALA